MQPHLVVDGHAVNWHNRTGSGRRKHELAAH
jgi:hypothetical protein